MAQLQKKDIVHRVKAYARAILCVRSWRCAATCWPAPRRYAFYGRWKFTLRSEPLFDFDAELAAA